jgi:hypothetical protein
MIGVVAIYFARAVLVLAAVALLSLVGIGCDVDAPDVHLGFIVAGGVCFIVALVRELWRAR